MKMTKRQTEKIVKLRGRTFKIRKFDAFTGSYIAYMLLEKFMPGGMEEKAGLNDMPAGRAPMSRQEFKALQIDCLSVVSEQLPAGDRPMFNANGTWGLMDVENDTFLVLLLTIHSLAFNIAGFFDGAELKELKMSLADILPARMQTSTDMSMPLS